MDRQFGHVLATGATPMISRIRLAWWREALERLDVAPPPSQPLLQAAALHLLPASVGGAELAAMEAGWLALTEAVVGEEEVHDHAIHRGRTLFTLAARLLGTSVDRLESAGEAWALVDLARHSSSAEEAAIALAAARVRDLPRRWPKALRPLGMIAALAARDLRGGPPFETVGSPARRARMMRMALLGR